MLLCLNFFKDYTQLLSTVHKLHLLANYVCYHNCCMQAPLTNPDYPAPRDWPHDGVVEFNKYSTRYRPGLELVLQDLSCRIESGEKVSPRLFSYLFASSILSRFFSFCILVNINVLLIVKPFEYSK